LYFVHAEQPQFSSSGEKIGWMSCRKRNVFEDIAIFPTLAYKAAQSRPARHAVAVLMLLKNKRKPQKAPFAGPAIL